MEMHMTTLLSKDPATRPHLREDERRCLNVENIALGAGEKELQGFSVDFD